MSSHSLLMLIIAAFIFAYIPGPALFYTAAQTISNGRKSGLMAALGIHMGAYIHIIAAAAGLALLLKLVPALYLTIKIAGALWLIWLGLQTFKQKKNIEISTKNLPQQTFFKSVLVESLNPKTAIFYIAFLPQFIDRSATFPVWAQFIVLGMIVNIIATSADVICVFLAQWFTTHLKRSNLSQKVFQYLSGSIFIALGIRLGLSKN